MKEVRKALGLSQTAFADRMAFGRAYVSLIERGVAKNPSRRFLEQLSMMEGEANIHQDVTNILHSKSKRGEAQDLPPDESRMPYHHCPGPQSRIRDDPGVLIGTSDESAFRDAVRQLSELHERNPQAFAVVAAMISGLHQKQP